MSDELQALGSGGLELMRNLADALKTKRQIEEQEKALKAQLLDLMEQYQVKSVDNDFVRISYVSPSESTSIDLKALEREEPGLFADLIGDYPKTTRRAASIRINVK